MKKVLALLFAGFAIAQLCFAAAPQVIDTELKDAARDRTIPIKVRLPDGGGKAPLVIFSHGLGGSREGGKAWGEHWAANGYLVVHVQHAGSDTEALRNAYRENGNAPSKALREIASPENLVGRVDDVRFLISEIERQQKSDTKSWVARAELSRIAMAGHSFGAHTSMALAGQRFPGPVKSLADPRIRAFIVLSPNATGLPRTHAERYGEMKRPMFSITGTRDGDPLGRDRNLAKAVERRVAVFTNQPPGDKYLLVLNDADHMVFNGDNTEDSRARTLVGSEPIAAATRDGIYKTTKMATLKFLDAYLRDDADATAWLQKDAASALTPFGEWKSK